MQEETGERLTVAEAAARVGVAESSVRRWTTAGRMRPVGETERGAPLFDAAEVERVAAAEASARAASRPGGVPPLGALAARRRPWGEAGLELPPLPSPSFARGIDEAAVVARLARFLGAVEPGAPVVLVHARGGAVAMDMTEEDGRDELAARLARALVDDAEARGGRQSYRVGLDGGAQALTVTVRAPDLDDGEARGGQAFTAQAVGHVEFFARQVLDQARHAETAHAASRAEDRRVYEAHLRSLEGQLEKAQSRIAELEVRAEEIAKLREEALNNAAERDEMRLNAAAEREREAAASQTNQRLKERSLGEMMKLAPNILPPMLRKLGLEVPTATESDVVMQNAASLFGELDDGDRAQLGAFVREKKGELAFRRFVAVCEAFQPEQDAAAAAAAAPASSAAPPAPLVAPSGASLSPGEIDAISKRLDELNGVSEASMAELERAKKAGDRKAMLAARARVTAAQAEIATLGARLAS